jgi:subtilisin family serine protease
MPEKMRVLIQMRHTPQLSAAALAAAPMTVTALAPWLAIDGVSIDPNYAPVQTPARQPREHIGVMEIGRLFTFDARPEVSTYLMRGEVEDDAALNRLMEAVDRHPNGVGVFSDPRISAIAVCPSGPVGTHEDVERLLTTAQLRANGMDGSNVMAAIVDTGINLAYLKSKGKTPQFDASKSWTPVRGTVPGSMPVDHGTMCAFDVCIAAPRCTLLDYALLQSRAQGGSVMEGFLSDAITAYSKLLAILSEAGPDKPALVVNNSWGMFHPSWDFPVGHSGNYSDNPEHPFNIIVESLEEAGADILFAAGNCGPECPDSRCQGVTSRAIYGANSHASVLCVGGATVNKVRLGYSSNGPGRLQAEKPDICAYTHFSGSGVYSADSGTSAACPVAAGVVAAIRSRHSTKDLSPAQLRQLLRRTAEDLGLAGFDYGHGFGLINVPNLIGSLDLRQVRQLAVGEIASGTLKETGDAVMFKVAIGDTLNLELDGAQGVDFDIYVKKGAEPTITSYDARGYTSSADEKILIKPVAPGDYYVMVRSYRGAGDFTLKAVLS